MTVHLLIRGKVQGVFYRASAKKKAEQLGIAGWVKNTRTGEVEAMASGEKENVAKFIEWCRTGPSEAKVDDVIVVEKETGSFERFEILR